MSRSLTLALLAAITLSTLGLPSDPPSGPALSQQESVPVFLIAIIPVLFSTEPDYYSWTPSRLPSSPR
jgi:hypothetical protein